MKKMKKNKRIRLSVSISPEINDMIIDNTSNRSRYIERALLQYLKDCGNDVSKIKL